MTISGKVRFAKPGDIPQIVELCYLHSRYENSEYSIVGKAENLKENLFGNTPKIHCLVIENDTVLLGYATYMKQYATWEAAEYLYMDCLFIREFARGLGFGEKLMEKIMEQSKVLGCDLVQWQTPDFNKRAMKFYNRMGATSKPKVRFFLLV